MTDAASKDSLTTSDENANMLTYRLPEVDGDASIFTALEDVVIGVEHFLVEPECNKDLVDGVLGFSTSDSLKCFNTENFSCAVNYDQMRIDFCDALDHDLPQGGKLKLEFLDGMLQRTDEGVHGKISLPTTCEDNPLNAKYADRVFSLDYDLEKESFLGNVGLESHSAGFSGRACGAEISDSSSANIPVHKSTYNQNPPLLDLMTVQELHDAFRGMFGRETSVTDKQWLKRRILFGLENHVELNGLNFLERGVTSYGNECRTTFSSSIESSESASGSFTVVLDNENMPGDGHVRRKRLAGSDSLKTFSSEVSKVGFGFVDRGNKAGVVVTQKRLRKPNMRYTKETLEHESKHYDGKNGISYKSSRDNFLRVRSRKQRCRKSFGAVPACIQVPFGLPVQKGHSNKNKSSLGHDSEDCEDNRLVGSNSDMETFSNESHEDISDDDCVKSRNTQKGRSPRKHHIMWTPSEVAKLIEGVSQCGVGRWINIKRLLFSSSKHRTSVDLKDKWRNLLKASCCQLQSKREVQRGQRLASHQAPEAILRRVRELGVNSVPYRKQSKSEVSCNATVANPFQATTANTLVPLSTGVGG